jgi:multiple sugar transport system ATP-binding protein
VAIGRAIVRRPHAYLMDEPLSALDALLRTEMRVELKRLQADLQQTLVYVTHDQIEALSMSDRIGVLRTGVLQQVDTPEVIYTRPANRFVAINVGAPPTNFIPCTREGNQLKHATFSCTLAQDFNLIDNARVELGIRPENVLIAFEKSADAAIPGEIFEVEPLGAEIIVDLKIGEDIIKAAVPAPFHGGVGQPVWVGLDRTAAHMLDSVTDQFVAYGSEEAPMFVEG